MTKLADKYITYRTESAPEAPEANAQAWLIQALRRLMGQ